MFQKHLISLVVVVLVLSTFSISTALQENETSKDTILQILQNVNESSIITHLLQIDENGPHPTGSSNLEQLKSYYVDQFESYGLDVDLHAWSQRQYSGENIIATQQGVGQHDNIIIVCAHYDSVPQGPGVDDDGSGVVAILESARVLSEYQFNSTIRYVLFSGEEQGLYGSSAYAEQCFTQHDNIISVIALDGIGSATNKTQGAFFKHLGDPNTDFVYQTSTQLIEAYPEHLPFTLLSLAHLGISDHQSFYEYGYASSYYFEYVLTPFYHTPEDNLEHLNTTYLTINTRLISTTLAKLAALDRNIQDEDLDITIKGSILSRPDGFQIGIQNNHQTQDAALLINITFTNLFTDEIVIGVHDSICQWTFTKNVEPNSIYTFRSGPRYIKPQLVNIHVTLKGQDEDLGLYFEESTSALSLGYLFLSLPKL